MMSEMHRPFGLFPFLLALPLILGCRDEATTKAGKNALESEPQAAKHSYFVDIAGESGLDFEHWNGGSGELYFVEPVGSGGALVDVDGDGDLDVLLLQGRRLSPAAKTSSPLGPPKKAGARLFRNDLSVDAEGKRELRFVDITESSGLDALGYGMGVATGDFDNDGRVDLYLTNFGPNQLWRNLSQDGKIRFADITAQAGEGLADARWSTSASFTDLDGDGFLDLYVTNYVDFRVERHKECRSAAGRIDYCGPQAYEGESDRLFRNRGDGTFEDITGKAGLLTEPSSGLGVVAADFDRDGHKDLYVANDLRRNVLWHNLAKGPLQGAPPEPLRFENIALESGCAVSMLGRAQASMGLVAGDIDNDGDDDLFMTHLRADTNTLYQNDGRGIFDDHTAASRLGAPSLETTGFGTALIDFDNDGWLDIAVANGAVKVIEKEVLAGDNYPLKEPNQLFRNRGDGTFEDVSRDAGPSFSLLEVSRGLAIGDIDNDGHSDILLVNNSGPARLLQNRNVNANHWLGLRLLTSTKDRDALGAEIELVREGQASLFRRAATDGSYLSANDPRVLFGLGSTGKLSGGKLSGGKLKASVHWPDGKKEIFEELEADRYHTLIEGQGQP